MEIVFSVIAFAMLILLLFMMVGAIRSRLSRLAIVLFAALAVAEAGIWFAVPQFPRRLSTALNTNVAETSPTPEFPELRTRTYAAKPDRVYEAVTTAIALRPDKWAVVSTDPAAGRVQATVGVLNFTDDVQIHVQSSGDTTQVDARSHSRVGKGDFGENRRHIAWLLEQLDQGMGGAGGR